MDSAKFIMIYACVWWIVIFTILPIGIKKDSNPSTGSDSGAPQNPQIGKKILITSLISLLISLIIKYFAYEGVLQDLFGS